MYAIEWRSRGTRYWERRGVKANPEEWTRSATRYDTAESAARRARYWQQHFPDNEYRVVQCEGG